MLAHPPVKNRLERLQHMGAQGDSELGADADSPSLTRRVLLFALLGTLLLAALSFLFVLYGVVTALVLLGVGWLLS